jgi:hypothetical protein
MAISGDNFQFGKNRTEYSYYFSRYNHIWGWASWRRAWQYYDVKMKLWEEIVADNWLMYILEEANVVRYWTKFFQATYDNKIDTWDYPWTFACWIQNGLTILPNVNLVSNIGFGEDGTHKISSKSPLANLPVEEIIFPQKHPPFLIRHIQADNYTQNNFLNPNLLIRLRNKLKKALLNHSR